MRDSVTVHMAASPEAVWELVSDVRNTGKFSPETLEAESSMGPPVRPSGRSSVDM